MGDRVVQDDAHVFDWAIAQVEQERAARMDYREDWIANDYWDMFAECDAEIFKEV